MSDRCRSCGAPIRWARTAKGTAVPLNPEPAPNGNVVLMGDGTVTYLGRGQAPPEGTLRWTSHFASCPEARRWRRRG
jgi:hypothetical protein